MRCGHCKAEGVNVPHVRACSGYEQGLRSIGSGEPILPRPAVAVELPTLAALWAKDQDDSIEGVYLGDGTYYKVQVGTNTGNPYAKVWNQLGDIPGQWEYVGRAPLHWLTEDHRVTAEQAARFGHVTGCCVFCTRKLTDERSIEVGYGPRCAEREGLPWG